MLLSEWCCEHIIIWHHSFSHRFVTVVILVCVSTDSWSCCCRLLHSLTWYLFLSQWKYNSFFWHLFLNILIFLLLMYFQFIDCLLFFFLSLSYECWFFQVFLFCLSTCLFHSWLLICIMILIIFLCLVMQTFRVFLSSTDFVFSFADVLHICCCDMLFNVIIHMSSVFPASVFIDLL